jgi:RHS repeat-associated protein
MMTDETNTVVWEAMYKPFGEATVHPNSTVVNNLRLPGQYEDEETGLHYNYHRYYDPRMGRYISPDPAGLEVGVNLYVYAENNSINNIDYYGLKVKRTNSKTLRKKWERYYNKKWPKDPNTGWNQDIAHKKAVSEGGAESDPRNYGPKTRNEHIEKHKKAGDYEKWGKQGAAARAKKLKGIGKTLGAMGFVLDAADFLDAKTRAEEKGINIWEQLLEDQGIPIIIYDECGNIIYCTPGYCEN